MRWAAGACLAATMTACGGASPAGQVEGSVVRVVGDVCGVPLFAAGVVVGDGLVLTAAHVVAGTAGELAIGLPSGELFPAEVVGFDPERDLAALTATGLTAAAVTIDDAVQGESGVIVSIDRNDTVTETPFEVERQITATGEDIYGEGDVSRQALELTAEIERGMSGAGAFDAEGALIGVVFAESMERRISYAVAAAELRSFLDAVDPGVTVPAGHC